MSMLSPAEFVGRYADIGARKACAPRMRLLLSGILAGVLIGAGGAVASTAAHALRNDGLVRMVSGLLFPFGLAMVVLTGAELFTGNCLMTISLLERRASVRGVLGNLAAVYLGNLLGALLLAAACAFGGQLRYSSGGLAVSTIALAAGKCAMPFFSALVMGVLCNILVCTAVMAAICAADVAGRILGAYVPVCVFVICGFEHCVANMFYIPAGIFAYRIPAYAALADAAGIDVSALGWGGFFLHNLLPVTLGNCIGGAGFAAWLWRCAR